MTTYDADLHEQVARLRTLATGWEREADDLDKFAHDGHPDLLASRIERNADIRRRAKAIFAIIGRQ